MQKEYQVALYIRVSTEEQVIGHSLSAQEAALREDVKRHGKLVYRVYQDAGVSGVREDRKGFNALLRDAKNGCFGEVLVWTVSRVSRKLSYLLQVVEELRVLDIAFCSMSEQFDITTPMGQFALTMMGAVAQMQRESWMESSYIGMKKRAKSGRCSGGMMLGYQMVPDTEDLRGGNKLVIVPTEAEIVRKIFSMYAMGLGYKAIVNRLNEEGKVGKNGGMFSSSSVRCILGNAAYVGKVRFGGEYNEGIHEPLVSKELWEEVHERMKNHPKVAPKQSDHEYLLSGIIKCPVCGSGMVAIHSKKRRKDGTYLYNYYYACGAYHNQGRTVCKSNIVRADHAEEKVLTWLHEFLTSPLWMRRVMEVIKQRYGIKARPLDECKKLEKGLTDITRQQHDILRRYEEDILDRDTFLAEMQRLKRDKENCQLRLSECMPEQEIPACWSTEEMKAAFRSFRQVLVKAEINQKRQLVRNLIATISVNENRQVSGIELQLVFGTSSDSVGEIVPLNVAI